MAVNTSASTTGKKEDHEIMAWREDKAKGWMKEQKD